MISLTRLSVLRGIAPLLLSMKFLLFFPLIVGFLWELFSFYVTWVQVLYAGNVVKPPETIICDIGLYK